VSLNFKLFRNEASHFPESLEMKYNFCFIIIFIVCSNFFQFFDCSLENKRHIRGRKIEENLKTRTKKTTNVFAETLPAIRRKRQIKADSVFVTDFTLSTAFDEGMETLKISSSMTLLPRKVQKQQVNKKFKI
jgi:hypothetical protein